MGTLQARPDVEENYLDAATSFTFAPEDPPYSDEDKVEEDSDKRSLKQSSVMGDSGGGVIATGEAVEMVANGSRPATELMMPPTAELDYLQNQEEGKQKEEEEERDADEYGSDSAHGEASTMEQGNLENLP